MPDISTFFRKTQQRLGAVPQQLNSQLGSAQERFSSAQERFAESRLGGQLSTAQTKVAGAVPASLRGGNLSRNQKFQIAGIATCSAAVLTCGIAIPAASSGGSASTSNEALSSSSAAFKSATGEQQAKDLHASVTNQMASADQQAKNAQAKLKAAQDAKAAEAKKKAAAAAAAKDRATQQAASRNAARKPVYANNLDGWIKESLDIMKSKGIPGSYEGLHRNILRESSGNTKAINNWDINAQNGIPSKGLLQVIQPTFDHYHVAGTSSNIYDPVANITAAANYAADRYGSMDNVNSAY